MLQRIDLRAGLGDLRGVLPRAAVDVGGATQTVAPLIDDVRHRGAAAVLDAAERFDGVRPPTLRVPAEVLEKAAAAAPPAVLGGLAEAIRRARLGHAAQLPQETVTTIAPGGTVTQRWVAVGRVGLYVPGGLALYPSSVVMNVVPAQVAGVSAIAVCSPPQRDNGGWPDGNVLAACAVLGVDEVYAAGGAQGDRAARARRHRHRRRGDRTRRRRSPARATCTSRPPSGCCAASSPSTPRPGRRRSR